jgi:hypothetical protein
MCGLFAQGPCFMPFLSDGILGVVSYNKEKRRTTWKNPGFHGFLIIPNLCTESSSGHSIVYLPRACPQVDLTVCMLGANNQLLLPWGQGWFWCIASHLSVKRNSPFASVIVRLSCFMKGVVKVCNGTNLWQFFWKSGCIWVGNRCVRWVSGCNGIQHSRV